MAAIAATPVNRSNSANTYGSSSISNSGNSSTSNSRSCGRDIVLQYYSSTLLVNYELLRTIFVRVLVSKKLAPRVFQNY